MNKKYFFILFIILNSTFNGLSQKFTIIYDSCHTAIETICYDTMQWQWNDKGNTTHIKYYPINADISFSMKPDLPDITSKLNSCFFNKCKHSYTLLLTNISLSYEIRLQIIIRKNKYKSKLFFYYELFPHEKKFHVTSCILKLNREFYKIGDVVWGYVKLEFQGSLPDLETGRGRSVEGFLIGNFSARVE